jgi:thiol:disulfide interchange protein
MKVLLILLTFTISLLAEITYAPSYKEALEQAAKEDKLVMVMLSKEDCDACWYMENVVFEDKAIATRIMKNFVPLHLDIHNDYLHKLSYIGTPTFHFITSKEYKRFRHDGAANVKEFNHILDEVLLLKSKSH